MTGEELIVAALSAGAVALAKEAATETVKTCYRALKRIVTDLTNDDVLADTAFPPDEERIKSERGLEARQRVTALLQNADLQALRSAEAKAHELIRAVQSVPQADLVFTAIDLVVDERGQVEINNNGGRANVNMTKAKVIRGGAVRVRNQEPPR
jgi:hypothetical protein